MSSFVLKILAVISMLIDHIGFVFFPNLKILRVLGRIAMPIFAFQISLGFEHTRSREKYIERMLLFALASQVPFMLMSSIRVETVPLNIGFTFLLSLLFLYSVEEVKPVWGKILGSVAILIVAYFLKYDYWLYGFSLPIIYYYLNGKPQIMIPTLLFVTTLQCIYKNSTLQFGSLLTLFLIPFYNGKKGKSLPGFFYAFYPLHMLALFVMYQILS